MISGSKDILRSDAQAAREFRQCGPFVIVPVTKPQINRVSLVGEFRKYRSKFHQLRRHAIHHRFVHRHQTDEPSFLLDQRDVRKRRKPVRQLSQHPGRFIEERVVPLPADAVPIAKFPPAASTVGLVDFPLKREEKIRRDRCVEDFETLHGVFEGATGIDGPECALLLRLQESLPERRNTATVGGMPDKCPVEIGADQSESSHSAGNSPRPIKIDKSFTIPALSRSISGMKSAYEIAMSRLEAAAPSVKLSDAQKSELAEIDNLYESRIAERRVFLESEIRKAQDPATADQLRRQLAGDVARLEEEREARKEKVRQG
jgi:hypothetical protein